MHQKCVCSWTQLGELTVFPQIPSLDLGEGKQTGRMGKKRARYAKGTEKE